MNIMLYFLDKNAEFLNVFDMTMIHFIFVRHGWVSKSIIPLTPNKRKRTFIDFADSKFKFPHFRTFKILLKLGKILDKIECWEWISVQRLNKSCFDFIPK